MLKKIRYIFNREQKFKLLILLFMIIIGTILELIGVSSILPFVNLILDPESTMKNKYLSLLMDILNISSARELLLVVAVLLIIIYFVKNLYLMLLYSFQYKFINNNQRKISLKLLSAYMKQPYLYHLSKNSSELIRNVRTDVSMLFNLVLGCLQMLTDICVCTALSIYLFITDKSITVGVISALVLFLLLFVKVFRKKLNHYGTQFRNDDSQMVKWLNQSFNGIKEIKVLEREEYFESNYNYYYEDYSRLHSKSQLLEIIPKPIMETLCISGILVVISIKIWSGVDITYFIPTVSVFAVAAIKLLPSFNKIAAYLSIIMYNKVAVDSVYNDLKEIDTLIYNKHEKDKDILPLMIKKHIKIENISFRYPNVEKYVLKDVSLDIPIGKSIAIIGPSGAGKTTLADIVLGLLEPEKGLIFADGKNIFENMSAWHKNIGYIPQAIYLMDDTIKNNIIFGLPEKEIDEKRLENALVDAQLTDFIIELEQGLETVVGEHGVRLSGGQRQRIGIARALYHDPQILVLDEATSALDNDTENAVMEAIDRLHGKKTLIIIAHRLTTIKNCDIVFKVENETVEMITN